MDHPNAIWIRQHIFEIMAERSLNARLLSGIASPAGPQISEMTGAQKLASILGLEHLSRFSEESVNIFRSWFSKKVQ